MNINGLLSDKRDKQLIHLHEVITEEKYWYSDRFRLMNNEAGSGKSIQTFESIAALAINTNYRIVYVQMFANEDSEKLDAKELKNTVDAINKKAGQNIAKYLCTENKNKHTEIIDKSQVICITHRKYLSLCADKSKSNFITKEFDVLIIDEFPNLFQSFYISEIELMKLHGFSLINEKEKESIERLTSYFVNKLSKLHEENGAEMKIVNLHKHDVKGYIKILNTIIKHAEASNRMAYSEVLDIANKTIEVLSHLSVYSYKLIGKKRYPVLCSYYGEVDYILAKKCNIILDANGAFDARYKLREDLFQLDKQSKVFDYTESSINLYPIPTTKTALNKYVNIIEDVANKIDNRKGFVKKEKHLIISDIKTKEKIKKDVAEIYEISNNIYLAHFGALIGKNDWKEFDNIWIVKTHYYSWVEYILQYCFYKRSDINGNVDCSIKSIKGEYGKYTVFENAKFNEFKSRIVLGDYYQACKRIARDGRKCTFNIITADEDVYKLLVKQFKNIVSNTKNDLTIRVIEKKKKPTGKPPVKTNERVEMARAFLIDAKQRGESMVKKSELVDMLQIKATKLIEILRKITDVSFEIGKGKEQSYIFLK